MGPTATTNRLYKTIVTILVESFALYTVTFLLFIGTWSARSDFVYTFFPILVETQVSASFTDPPQCLSNHGGEQAIAPLLITSRVVNQNASTSDHTSPGNTGPIRFRSRWEYTGGCGTLSDENPMGAPIEITLGELGTGVEGSTDENLSCQP